MDMYYLNKYDYNKKINEVIYYDTLINVIHEMKLQTMNYIIHKQGSNISINYKDFIYNDNEKPIRKRRELTGPFYIKPSKNINNCLTIKEYRKIYGYLYNSYEDINHVRFTISKANKKAIKKYWKDKFENKEVYTEVIKSINNKNKIDDDYLFINNDEFINNYNDEFINNYEEITETEKSKSEPIPIKKYHLTNN
jgi:hypothetical protein